MHASQILHYSSGNENSAEECFLKSIWLQVSFCLGPVSSFQWEGTLQVYFAFCQKGINAMKSKCHI